MGLVVWLPLLGNLNNQGTSAIQATGSDVTVNANGKLGSCYSFNKNNYSHIKLSEAPFDNSTEEFSYCCWVKLNDTSTSTCLFSNRNASTQYGISIFINNSGNILFDTGARATWSQTIAANTWTHLAFVYKKNVTKDVYINGTLAFHTNHNTAATAANTTNAFIGASQYNATTANANYMNGFLNDVRIYNHALSVAEIHEISQGLVAHYKLDSFSGGYSNPNLGNTSATYSNQQNGVEINASGWGGDAGKVTYYHSGGYAGLPYKVYHKTTTGSGGIYYKTANDIVLEANTTYTMSIWIKASREFSDSAYNFCINRGSDNRYINYGSSFAIKTEWTYYTKTFTTPSDGAGSYGEMSIIYNDAVTDYYIYFSGFKIEKGSVATAWCPPGASLTQRASLTQIQDSSGYEHNGILTNTAFITSNTPRYSNAIYLSKVKINCTDGFPTGENPNFTISFWTKILSTITYVSYGDLIGMYDTGQGSNTFRLELCGSPASNNLKWFRGPSGQNSGGFDMNSSSSSGWFTKDTWHHIVLAGDGTNKKYYCYLDGNLCQTYNGSANSWQPTGQWYLGDTDEATAYFSDLRIYCTALSAADVKQLYEMGAKVDNKGNLHTYEFNEFGSNKLKKTGVFYNYATEPYMQLTDGSCWKLMLFHYVDGGNNLFTSSNATYNDGFGLYSRLRDIDNFQYNNKYEFYVIQDGKEFRWTQTSQPTASSIAGLTTVSGYTNPVNGLARSGHSNTYIGYNSWWGACGCKTSYSTGGKTGIPGFGSHDANGICTTYLALYTRIDKITYRNASNAHYANNLIEI